MPLEQLDICNPAVLILMTTTPILRRLSSPFPKCPEKRIGVGKTATEGDFLEAKSFVAQKLTGNVEPCFVQFLSGKSTHMN